MDFGKVSLSKPVILVFLIALGSTTVLAESLTLTDGDEICGDLTASNGANYDTVEVTGNVEICTEGASIETDTRIEVTETGVLDGIGIDGEDGEEGEPGENGEDGADIALESAEVLVQGEINVDGGDGGDGGPGSTGNEDGFDGGDGGDSGDITLSTIEETKKVDNALISAEGGAAGEGGEAGGGASSSGDLGDGGDGGIITLRYSEITEENTEYLFSGGLNAEDGHLIRENPEFTFTSFSAPNEVERDQDLVVVTEVENEGGFEGPVTVEYFFENEFKSSAETDVIAPGERDEVELIYEEVDEERGNYEHRVELPEDAFFQDIFVEDDVFKVDIYDTNSPAQEILEVDVNISNEGGIDGIQEIEFFFDGAFEDSLETETIEPGDSSQFQFEKDVSDLQDDYEVTVKSDDDSDDRNVLVGDDPFFEVDIVELNNPDVGGEAVVNSSVENIGGREDTQDIAFFFNGDFKESFQDLTLEGDEQTYVEFTYSTDSNDGGFNNVTVESEDNLDRDEILIGDDADFQVEITNSNEPIDPGEILEIDAEVENIGDAEDTQDVNFFYDSFLEDSETLNLDGGESNELRFTYDTSGDPEGRYDVLLESDNDIDELRASVGFYELAEGDTDDGYMSQVVLEGINQESGDDDGYADFTERITGQSATLARGETYQIEMSSADAPGRADHYMSLFVDFSSNFDFDDGVELIAACDNECDGATGTFEIPEDAELGKTRMRTFLGVDSYQRDPDDLDFLGEAEDYTVDLIGSDYEITDFERPSNAVERDEINPNATITNTGEAEGTKTVDYIIDGEVKDSEEINLQPEESKTVEFEYIVEEPLGSYLQEVETIDDDTSSSLEVDGPDLNVVDIVTEASPVEDSPSPVTVEVENTGTVDAEEFELRLEVESFDGDSYDQYYSNNTALSLSVDESKTTEFEVRYRQGPSRINGSADPDEVVTAANDLRTESIDIGSYHTFYGDLDETLVLGGTEQSFTWDVEKTERSLLYVDTDADVDFANIDPVAEDRLSPVDQSLGIEEHSDSITDVWDTNNDGKADRLSCFRISGADTCDVPAVNSTNTDTFETGILYENDGANFDGGQPLIFASTVQPNSEGKFGTYDYEAKIPASLRTQKGPNEAVDIYVEVGE